MDNIRRRERNIRTDRKEEEHTKKNLQIRKPTAKLQNYAAGWIYHENLSPDEFINLLITTWTKHLIEILCKSRRILMLKETNTRLKVATICSRCVRLFCDQFLRWLDAVGLGNFALLFIAN